MSNYGSRKFIVTMSAMAAAVFLASIGKMSGDVGGVLIAGIVAYNAANVGAIRYAKVPSEG